MVCWYTCASLHKLHKSPKALLSKNSSIILSGETDADWSGDVNDRKSTTGYYFKLGNSGGAVSLRVKEQATVSLSSCEGEYQGLAAAVQEAIFLRSILCDIGYEQNDPTILGEDNQSCIKIATNPVMHKRSKHIDTKYHFIRENVEDHSVGVNYLHCSSNQLHKLLSQNKLE